MAGPAESPTLFQRALPLTLALGALALLLLALEISRPCAFLQDDNATWFAGAYLHDDRVLTGTGRVAVVNYYQYGGEPFLGQGQTGVLYPPVYIGEELAKIICGDPRWAIEWIAAMHLLIGVAGFYFWLRRHGVAPTFAAVGSLAWALNPFVMIVASSWIVVTYVAAWLPWLFWAFDRLLVRPSLFSSALLGTILGLFFLQGYVQWVVYALLFLGLYAVYQFITRKEIRRLRVVGGLFLAVLIFLVWAMPLLLPMLHAVGASAARSRVVDLSQMLFYRVESGDLWPAQWGQFYPFMFGVSTAIFFCPALVLLPYAALRFFRAKPETRHPLFAFILLAVIALVLSGRWYFLLSHVPLVDKFRWPFKVFVFADFFLLGALVLALSLASRRVWAMACALVVLVAEATVSLSQHDGNFFSKTTLPTTQADLPRSVDLTRGRVVAIDDHLPEAASSRFITHGYGTFYAVPSIGGYNPLVGRETLQFGLGIDFPNVLAPPITPELREKLEARAVRYWMVDPVVLDASGIKPFGGFRILGGDKDRLIFEDLRAKPMAYATADPATACPLRYSGNSMLVSLEHAISPVKISVGPGDGWWYRLDRGPWLKADYRNDGLLLDFPAATRQLEISYFDPRFQAGLFVSGFLLLALLLAMGWTMRRGIS